MSKKIEIQSQIRHVLYWRLLLLLLLQMTTPLVLGSGCGSSSSENTPGSTSSSNGTSILQVALEPVVELVLKPSTPVRVCD